MNLLIAILVGSIVGWSAARLEGRETSVLLNVAVGMAGAVLGSILVTLLLGEIHHYLQLSIAGVVWSVLGAVVVISTLNTIEDRNQL